MCIIAVKPAGIEWPTWKTLQTCFEHNSDGAGYMYNDDEGNVVISKGYMSWQDFKKAIKMLKRRCTDDTAVVMHFRIKTHGEVSRECCHPFPLDFKLDELRKVENVCNIGIAHNGIISGRNTTPLKSDTMDYIMNYLYNIYALNRDFYKLPIADELITSSISGSRLCIMDGAGKLKMYGQWHSEDGCYYSNTSYREPRYTYPAYAYPTYYRPANSTPAKTTSIAKSNNTDTVNTAPFGEDEDYDAQFETWLEEYDSTGVISDSTKKAYEDERNFFDSMPSNVCALCPDYMSCVSDYCWWCADKDSALAYYDMMVERKLNE